MIILLLQMLVTLDSATPRTIGSRMWMIVAFSPQRGSLLCVRRWLGVTSPAEHLGRLLTLKLPVRARCFNSWIIAPVTIIAGLLAKTIKRLLALQTGSLVVAARCQSLPLRRLTAGRRRCVMPAELMQKIRLQVLRLRRRVMF